MMSAMSLLQIRVTMPDKRDCDAAMNGKARDARVVPRAGKGGDGACRRAACVSPCPWGDHEESRATHPSWQQLLSAGKRA